MKLFDSSTIVDTPHGPIEYATQGDGAAVLVIHGCPGGFDQGLMAAKLANRGAFKFVAPSRPGYLRTPLAVGATPEAQADAYAALLDALGISRAAIIGISGGGPSAFQFALRHPDRCWALVAVSAISKRLSQAEITNCKSVVRRTFFLLGLVAKFLWYGAAAATKGCRDSLLKSLIGKRLRRAFERPNKKEDVDFFLGMLRSCSMVSMRKPGLKNDMKQLTTMDPIPLEKIHSPTLVMHGTDDRVVPFSHAEWVAGKVPGSEFVEIQGGGHLFFATHREKVVPAVIEFLQRNAIPQRQKN